MIYRHIIWASITLILLIPSYSLAQSAAESTVRSAPAITTAAVSNEGTMVRAVPDNGDLVKKADGSPSAVANENDPDKQASPDWYQHLLKMITVPTTAYLLLLLGVYGLFFEMVNPGFVAPGVIGAVALLVALYALQFLPVNYVGLALILLGLLFLVGEAFTPSYGLLGLTGSVVFVIGSVLLIDTQQEAYQIAWSAILTMAAANILVIVGLVSMIIKSRRQSVQHGMVVMIGEQGKTLGHVNLEGQAVIHGEIWNVRAKKPISANKSIKVIAAEGLLLEVEEIKGE